MGLHEIKRILILGAATVSVWTLTAIVCNAQSNLSGEYMRNISETAQRLVFNDTTFRKYGYSHVKSSVSGGSFTIKGDTLILEYKPLTDPDPSWWEFSRKDTLSNRQAQLTDALQVNFTATGTEGERDRIFLVLMNEDEEPITAFAMDSVLTYPVFFLSGDNIQEFRFSGLNRETINISADTLKGFRSEVRVYLAKPNTTYRDTGGIEVYLIEFEEDRIILEELETGRKLYYNREE